MARRVGRPKKNSEGSVAVAEKPIVTLPKKKKESPYSTPYGGRRWWVLAIKADPEKGYLPCEHFAAGGICWQRGTQRQVMADGWAALDGYRKRATRALLRYDQVVLAAKKIRNCVVRWKKSTLKTGTETVEKWSASIISLEQCTKVKNAKTRMYESSGYRFNPLPGDEPLAGHLVFLPRTMIEGATGVNYDPDIRPFQTMIDLDPTLIPDRMKGSDGEFVSSGEDEVW